ncbi:MAG: DUF4405 domain-containing protein [Brucellaceae bacterium]|nr:DUF4405 domain-containing protein [Brucellaceae bacterium]
MQAFLNRYATPLTTGLFLVSLISGIALFFHWGSQYFHGMHEWLSMVLIVPFVLHVWRNWHKFITYFKKPAMSAALVLSVAGALAFVVPVMNQPAGGARRGPPQFAVIQAVQNAPVAVAAPLFGHDGESLAAALREKGYTVASADQTLDQVAEASGKSGTELMGLIGSLKK